MATSLGLVGLPNVGKTTVFNALTAAGAAAENYPFCTVQKNVAVVPVPDARLQRLAHCLSPEEVRPTTLEVIDIAGLVRGAHTGEGLGNRFLDDIRNVDAVFHIVRCFHDSSVARAGGSSTPALDLALVDTELIMADLQVVERRMAQLAKKAKASAGPPPESELLQRVAAHLEEGHLLTSMALTEDERDQLRIECLLTTLPCVVVANTDEDHLDPSGEDIREVANAAGERRMVVFPGQIEAEIASLDDDDRIAYFREFGLEGSIVPELLRVGFGLLGLITFYTVARNKLHAWRLREGGTALDAANLIHSEIGAGFIRADVCSADELLEAGTVASLRASGTLRSEGRDYVVQDGDVLYVHFHAA